MTQRSAAQLTKAVVPVHAHTGSRVLQRTCDCGRHAMGGECEGCKKKKLLQRRDLGGRESSAAIDVGPQFRSAGDTPGNTSSIADDVQHKTGHAANGTVRSQGGSRPGPDISRVRVHTDGNTLNGSAAAHHALSGPAFYAPRPAGGNLRRFRELSVNEPGDRFEQEADRVAEAVMSQANPAMPLARSVLPAQAQRKSTRRTEEDDEKRLQRKESAWGCVTDAAPLVDAVLNGPGQSLDAGIRSLMENRFGQDFRDVRIHTGTEAAASAKAVNALAYTVGNDIAFGEGQYRPGSANGGRLLAHELTHVVQQQYGSMPVRIARQASPTSIPVTLSFLTPPDIAKLQAPGDADFRSSLRTLEGHLRKTGGVTRKGEPQKFIDIRQAAGEIRTLLDYLRNPNVTAVKIVPSSKGGRSPDLWVRDVTGAGRRVEIYNITLASPEYRAQFRPGASGRPKIPTVTTQGGKTIIELPTNEFDITAIRDAIRSKVNASSKGPSQLDSQNKNTQVGGQPMSTGGDVVIQITHGEVSKTELNQLMQALGPELRNSSARRVTISTIDADEPRAGRKIFEYTIGENGLVENVRTPFYRAAAPGSPAQPHVTGSSPAAPTVAAGSQPKPAIAAAEPAEPPVAAAKPAKPPAPATEPPVPATRRVTPPPAAEERIPTVSWRGIGKTIFDIVLAIVVQFVLQKIAEGLQRREIDKALKALEPAIAAQFSAYYEQIIEKQSAGDEPLYSTVGYSLTFRHTLTSRANQELFKPSTEGEGYTGEMLGAGEAMKGDEMTFFAGASNPRVTIGSGAKPENSEDFQLVREEHGLFEDQVYRFSVSANLPRASSTELRDYVLARALRAELGVDAVSPKDAEELQNRLERLQAKVEREDAQKLAEEERTRKAEDARKQAKLKQAREASTAAPEPAPPLLPQPGPRPANTSLPSTADPFNFSGRPTQKSLFEQSADAADIVEALKKEFVERAEKLQAGKLSDAEAQAYRKEVEEWLRFLKEKLYPTLVAKGSPTWPSVERIKFVIWWAEEPEGKRALMR